MSKVWTDFHGEPLAVGDRIIPLGWGDGVPLYLSASTATIVGFGRTRLRVQFDGAVYGQTGKRTFPEYDTISTYVRKVTAKASCTCGGRNFESCICGISPRDYYASKEI